MKKYVKLLLMLAVVGVAVSCERSELPPTGDGVDETSGKLSNKSDDEAGVLGYWKTTLDDAMIGANKCRYEIAFRFWNDGDGYTTMEGYAVDGRLLYSSSSGFSYKVEGDMLSMCYDNYSQWNDAKISMTGDTLIIYNSDGYGLDLYLTRYEDADSRFIGDWHAVRKEGDYYYADHIQFITPTDCCTYNYKYKDLSSQPVDSSHVEWYKYEFDDDVIVIKSPGEETPYMKKYYRIDGSKLYVSDSKDGFATCYKKI